MLSVPSCGPIDEWFGVTDVWSVFGIEHNPKEVYVGKRTSMTPEHSYDDEGWHERNFPPALSMTPKPLHAHVLPIALLIDRTLTRHNKVHGDSKLCLDL